MSPADLLIFQTQHLCYTPVRRASRPGGGSRGNCLSARVEKVKLNGKPLYNFAISRWQRSRVDMRNVTTRPRFLSQGQGLYDPLILGVSSSSYSTMSQTATGHPASTPERVHSVVGTDDEAPVDIPLFTLPIPDEPIVTRKELWSYYCTYYSSSPRVCPLLTT